jgi:hypothetical protein
MTNGQQQLITNAVVLVLGWLLSKIGFRDIRTALVFGPTKLREFRIARLRERLKWDKRVHGSAYELCLYVFYEFFQMAFYLTLLVEVLVVNPGALPKGESAVLTIVGFISVLGWTFRLLKMMHRLTNYDREIPKLEAKLERLEREK